MLRSVVCGTEEAILVLIAARCAKKATLVLRSVVCSRGNHLSGDKARCAKKATSVRSVVCGRGSHFSATICNAGLSISMTGHIPVIYRS